MSRSAIAVSLASALALLALTAAPIASAVAAPKETPPAAGKDAADGKGKAGPCRADRKRLCPDAKDRESMRACLQTHAAELSPECKAFAEAKAERDDWQKDCTPEREKYCADVPPGNGRVIACLIGRKDDLSPACKPHVEAVIAKFKARRGGDAAKGPGGRKGGKGPKAE